MYKKVLADMKFVERENEVLAFWKDKDIYKKSIRPMKEGQKNYVMYDGPPTANGKPHIGHIETRSIKDIIPRFHSMKGESVLFKAGWDTHGLPVELEVEKLLGIDGKPQIEAYGVEPFIQQCRKSVWKYKNEWEKISERVGFWADMENPYVTYENTYIESVWWAIRTIWDKGMIYKGHKVVPYCPRCGTALSSHEVAQGYKSVKENSIFVRFAVRDQKDTYLAAWTTTPWTLPSNIGLCVNPDADYALVQVDTDVDGEEKPVHYYLAKELAGNLFEEYSVIEQKKGADLVGLHYEPLLPYATQEVQKSGKDAFRVVSDDYVTMSEGTGIVHIAPAFGEDDARVGRLFDLPFVQLVKEDGTLPEEAEELAGVFVKTADPMIIKKLKTEKKLIRKMPFEHDYPFCWRCDTPLIYYARTSWFIEMTKVRDNLLKNNASVNWYPENIKDGRMGNFLENVVDWSFSRERYWGTPLPIWECECGHRHCIGSVEELKSLSNDCPDDLELHKPYVDQVHIRCSKCQKQMTRTSEVIDCWFDSGAMPFAQYHYPFENKELFESGYPSQFISEAIDQTRGWFYSLLAIGTQLFDKAPFENCIVMGHVQDKNGIKMSKHKGNVIDPWDVLEKQGADATRWYFFAAAAPWLPSRFSMEAVDEGKRKFMGTLWNTYAFYIMYASIDHFSAADYKLEKEKLSVMDRWVLSRLHTVVMQVNTRLEAYDITGSSRLIQDFTDELSNWYVRRGRERYWGDETTQDKINAYMTLYTVLETLIRLLAPFVPFITESIYQNLVRGIFPDAPESVHLCDFPEADLSWVDTDLEEKMALVGSIVNLGRAARNTSAIKNRQPLSRLFIAYEGEPLPESYGRIIAEELNVKKLEYLSDGAGLVDYRFKPQLRTLGKKLGAKLNEARSVIESLPGKETKAILDAQGEIELQIGGDTIIFLAEDFLTETMQPEGLCTQEDKGITVSLDTKLTEILIEEGFIREIVSKIQMQRKEAEFEVTDRIRLYYDGNEKIAGIIERNKEQIARDVLAFDIVRGKGDNLKSWDINGEICEISVEIKKD